MITTEEWLAKRLADRPPLTQAQLDIFQGIFEPVIPHMRNAALAATRTAPAMPEPQEPLRGDLSDPR